MSRHAEDVAAYVDGVTSGRIVTGRLARLAVWRYLDDLQNAPVRGYEFRPEYAEEFLDFSEICCHTQGEWAGEPFISEPWQKFIDWNLFGWRRKDDGTRRFRKDYEELARKNGKTTRCAPKCFYLSLMDNPLEEGGQGYCVATKEEQAKLLFNEIRRCIAKSDGLRPYCRPMQKKIEFPSTLSYMQVLGSDSDSQDGFNPHFIVRDELHAWQEKHRELKEKLDTGFGARRQPLMMTITTAGSDRSTIWQEEHDYAVNVLESVITGEIIDDTFFAFIAAIDVHETPCFRCRGLGCAWCGGTGVIPEDDPFNEAVWIKANPNIGISAKWERLREAANEAKNKPTAKSQFLRYHCNVSVSSTEKAVSPETWSACRGDLSDWNDASRVHGGFDLGRSNDFAGAGIMARFDETDDDGHQFMRVEVRGRAWTCEDRHEDVQTNQIGRWIEEGLLSECNGDQVSFGDVEDWIASNTPIYAVKTWAFDPNNALRTGQRLQEDFGIEVFKFSQNAYRYNESVRTFLRLLTENHTVNGRVVRGLTHDGDPVLAWMVNNLIIRKDAKDQWMPDKGRSPQKIDLVVALLMALSECMFGEASEPTGTYYESNPLEIA